ncbi:MAG: hypothetical protein ABW186_15795, partial [Rhodanobacteraceae bacterium]
PFVVPAKAGIQRLPFRRFAKPPRQCAAPQAKSLGSRLRENDEKKPKGKMDSGLPRNDRNLSRQLNARA